MKYFTLLLGIILMLLTGCSHLGPKTVPRDRFDYNSSINNSWKEQALLNVVRLRYADVPLFVDVASVVSGYTLTSSVNLNGTVSSEKAVQGDFLALGGAAQYTDRPTITYAPISGERFTKNFMTPIPPKLFMFLLESGWNADLVFPLVVNAVNGHRGHIATGRHSRQGDPGYYRVVSLGQEIQHSGHLSMRVTKGKDNEETTLMFIYRDTMPPESWESLIEFEKLLGLQAGGNDFTVTYGVLPKTDLEIALQTRSLLQMMIILSTGIDVPAEHIAGGLALPPIISSDSQVKTRPQHLKIHSASDKPEDAFISVRYKDYWFWIDDGDFPSKRIFAFMMILSSLLESGSEAGIPLVTIPSG